MEFVKMQGLGNDFLFIDRFSAQADSAEDYSELALKLCHRQFGVGADGLVVVLPSATADAQMRIFNADGSEPEMCGNGIRCFARYVYDLGYCKKDVLRVETLAGVLTLFLSFHNGEVSAVQVDMGEPILTPELIPVMAQGEPVVGANISVDGRDLSFTAVSMGNPHCVLFVDDYEQCDWQRLGPLIEKHALFPKKTNVEFIRVDSRQELTMMVWERGAGPTLACGTGACAATVAAVLNGLSERKVTVHLPGGDLLLEWGEDNHLRMTGPAAYVFRGVLLDDRLSR